MKTARGRNGSLSNTNRGDCIAFDQCHLDETTELARKGTGGNPARSTATCNHDLDRLASTHRCIFRVRTARNRRAMLSSISPSGP